jgi:hypothetical protein
MSFDGDVLSSSFASTLAAASSSTSTSTSHGAKRGSLNAPARSLTPTRGLTLKTYMSEKIDIDVSMAMGTWCLQLFGTQGTCP